MMMMMMMMIIIIIIIIIIKVIIKKMNKKKRYTVLFHVISFKWRSSTIITFCLILNVWMKFPVHWSILDNRFSELKKNLMVKTFAEKFQNMIVVSKKTFVDALNTSGIYSSNFNFVSSRRGWLFRNRKIDSFPKEKIFPIRNNCT